MLNRAGLHSAMLNSSALHYGALNCALLCDTVCDNFALDSTWLYSTCFCNLLCLDITLLCMTSATTRLSSLSSELCGYNYAKLDFTSLGLALYST